MQLESLKTALSSSESGSGRVLILSGTTPGTGGVGNLLLKDCCDAMGRQSFLYCALCRTHELETARANSYVDFVMERRFETAFRPASGFIGDAIGNQAFRLLCSRQASKNVGQIARALKDSDIRRLWAVLDCPVVILMARQLAALLQVPLTAFVMDAPDQVAHMYYHAPGAVKRICDEAERILRQADACGVAGESMKSAYEARYGIRCEILRQGAVSTYEERPTCPDDKKLIIGFAGTLTANDAFSAFINAMDSVHWEINGRKVILRLIGPVCDMRCAVPRNVEFCGWRSREETGRLLSECTLLYLPQPFNSRQRAFAELSFPNKLMAYLPAGRPILVHGPEYASLIPFLRSYNVGSTSTSLAPEAIVCSVQNMVSDHAGSELAQRECERAIREEFNFDRLRKNVLSLLQVPMTNATA